MGEPSGEIISPPQPIETEEPDFNSGLSVNGSQLIALADLGYLEEHGFVRPFRPNILDRLKTLKARPALQRLTAIKNLILEGKTREAKDLLQQGLALANSISGVIDGKYVEGAEAVKKYIEKITNALFTPISVQEATKDYRNYDKSFREFIQSLPGKPLVSDQLEERTFIFLTQLGVGATVNPENNLLTLSPFHIIEGSALLPADQQHPLHIQKKEVIGEEGKETALAKLEVFAELAKRYPKVFTHMTGVNKLPAIIQSGHFGKDYGKGFKGNASERGLFAEELTFKDALQYTQAIQQLKAGNEIAIPWNEINPNQDIKLASSASLGYNYPLHELTYINPKDMNPVAIFSDQLPQEHKIQNWLIDGAIDIKDKCLVGIWVTPQYKPHLLHWISTWTDEKRQEVFGERKPEEVLISSAKDLPPLEK